MTKLPASLDAAAVLDDLKFLVEAAERGTGLRVVGATVDLLATTSRTGGAGLPELRVWAAPRDVLAGELTRADTHRLTFTLKRAGAARNFDRLPEHLQDAIRLVQDGLRALAGLRDDFDTTARMEFRFELTSEGKFNFLLRFTARALDAHSLTLEVEPVAPSPV